uniref:UPAR/Ly6 domain-containing protein n=1 Tax=Oryzias sinensis TaxID=183150 RepID=A0A8C8DET7_9TELE
FTFLKINKSINLLTRLNRGGKGCEVLIIFKHNLCFVSVDSSKTTPNGRQCFTCDGSTCDKTLACEGNEDHCVIETVDVGGNTTTIKGCISKLMCSVLNIFPFLFPRIKFSCCKGNLCNSAVTASAGLQLVVVALVSLTLFS